MSPFLCFYYFEPTIPVWLQCNYFPEFCVSVRACDLSLRHGNRCARHRGRLYLSLSSLFFSFNPYIHMPLFSVTSVSFLSFQFPFSLSLLLLSELAARSEQPNTEIRVSYTRGIRGGNWIVARCHIGANSRGRENLDWTREQDTISHPSDAVILNCGYYTLIDTQWKDKTHRGPKN